MNEAVYVPIFDQECDLCAASPCVGLTLEEGVRSTARCAVCFFGDRAMLDWQDWNDREESTE